MIPRLADTPVLTTARLTLRAPTAADWPQWREFATSERAQYVGGPYSEAGAWRSFGHEIGHWVMRGFGSFVFSLKDGTALGFAGPWYPAGWPELEIGWNLWASGDEGKGYATEAATATRAHVFKDLRWTTAVSYIDPANAPSIALAERLGATRDHTAQGPGGTELVFRHPAPGDLP